MLDHIGIPLVWCDVVLCASPIHQIGRRLQVIPCKDPRDHLPVLIKIDIQRWGGQQVRSNGTPDGVDREEVKWDRDKMMQGVRGGRVREDFVRDVERELEEVWQAVQSDMPKPDDLMLQLDYVLRRVGTRHFQQARVRHSPSSQSSLCSQRLALLAERRRLRNELGDSEDFERCCERLRELTKQCKSLYRRRRTARNDQLVQELWDAWRARDLSLVHRLSLRIAGSRFGRAKRDLHKLDGALPTPAQWMEVWEQEGGDGGMQAVQGDWEAMCRHQDALLTPGGVNDSSANAACSRALLDLELLQKYVARAPKRRGVPV
eukprot:1649436-Pyramimonas_sp.AAC.1